MTLSSFSCELTDRMDSRCSSWTMRPAKRLNVLGIRTDGLTSISTPLAVWMYICSFPALLMGESRRVSRHWTLKSARHYNVSGIYSHLMCDVGSCVAYVTTHFPHDANMFIAV